MQYFVEGVLPQKHSETYKLKKLVARYFLHKGILFNKGYDGDPLRCLGPEETKEVIKEVTSRGIRRAPREKKAIPVYATNGLLLAHYEERYSRICEEMS